MTLAPTNRELFLTAWRVVTQFNGGAAPAAEDVRILKLSARQGEKKLRIDALACAIIQRELCEAA